MSKRIKLEAPIDCVPDAILDKIFSYVEPTDRYCIARTCRRFCGRILEDLDRYIEDLEDSETDLQSRIQDRPMILTTILDRDGRFRGEIRPATESDVALWAERLIAIRDEKYRAACDWATLKSMCA